MGYATRAREASEQLESRRWEVRRWTAFKPSAAGNEERRRDREANLQRFANLLERRLRATLDDDALVKVVRVDREPQLMFQVRVLAPNMNAAKEKARYYIERKVLATPVPVMPGPRKGARSTALVATIVKLRPPWGKWYAEEIPQRKLRVGESHRDEDD